MKIDEKTSLIELMKIPGVGKSIAKDLTDLGFEKPEDLIGKNPYKMCDDSCALVGQTIDRCLLYVYKCAVYFAESENPNPELLKWQNWKDSSLIKEDKNTWQTQR